MKDFKPTWLYIKQHNVTGLKYFGKTIADPLLYPGSGIVWTRHLNKHGDDVSTIWTQLFEDKDKIREYAIEFSKENNIVESKEWANLKIEDGHMGGYYGIVTEETRKKISDKSKQYKHSDESKRKISDKLKGRIFSEEWSERLNKTRVGRKHTEESKQKMSESKKGFKHSDETKIKISKMVKGKNTGRDNPFFGKTHTPEVMEKIKATKKLKLEKLGENDVTPRNI